MTTKSEFSIDYSKVIYEQLQRISQLLSKAHETVTPNEWSEADKKTAYTIELNRRSLAQVNDEWLQSPEYARRMAKKAQEQANREEKRIKNIVGDEHW